MTLAEKRLTIEVLLCAGCDANRVSLLDAGLAVGFEVSTSSPVFEASYRRIPPGQMRFGHRLSDVAYRLIESSPTLRREWFGRR